MIKRYKICLLLLLPLLCFPLKAEEIKGIVVSAANWPDYTEKDGTGIYYALLKAIYGENNLTFLTSTYSRALNQFNLKKSDIMMGVYQHEVPHAHYANWFLDTDMAVQAFFRIGSEDKIITKESFREKLVAWRSGFGFEKFFPQVTSPYKIDSLEVGFRLLASGRIDYLLDYEHNFDKTYKKQIQYQAVHFGEKLYLAFQNTARGKKLAKKFDVKMSRLHANGKLKQIFGTEYIRAGFGNIDVAPLK